MDDFSLLYVSLQDALKIILFLFIYIFIYNKPILWICRGNKLIRGSKLTKYPERIPARFKEDYL
jgi:hypothetical protein